jgi:hypothetical protein
MLVYARGCAWVCKFARACACVRDVFIISLDAPVTKREEVCLFNGDASLVMCMIEEAIFMQIALFYCPEMGLQRVTRGARAMSIRAVHHVLTTPNHAVCALE